MRLCHARTAVLMAPLFLGACAGLDSGAVVVKSEGIMAGRNSAAEYMEAGRTHFSAKRYGLALEAFKGGLGLEARSVNALNWVGACYDMLGRFDLARRYFLQALHIEPGSAQTLNNIGYSFLLQRDSDRARLYLSEAAKSLAKNDAVAERVIAANLAAVGKPAAAGTNPADARGKAAGRLSREIRDTGAMLIRLAENVYEIRTDQAGGGRARSVALRQRRADPAVAPKPARPEPALGTVAPGGTGSSAAEKPEASDRDSGQAELAMRSDNPVPVERNQCLRAPTVEVSNGAGRHGFAARMTRYLERNGVPVELVTNAEAFGFQKSVIQYARGYRRVAEHIRSLLPGPVELESVNNQYANIRVRVGGDLLEFDHRLRAAKEQPAVRGDNVIVCGAPTIVEVSNGAGRRGLAARLTRHLELKGIPVDLVTNAAVFTHRKSVILYSEGYRKEAETIARFLPLSVELQAAKDQYAHVRIRLGGDVLEFDRNLTETSKQVL